MSKSLGNSLLLSDLLGKYSDEAIKFALLQTNYRNDINVTDDLFPEAEKHLYEFYSALASAEGAHLSAGAADKGAYAEKIDAEFDECMSDDFNTALALGNLFGYFKELKKLVSEKDPRAAAVAAQIRATYSLLGLFRKDAAAYVKWYESKISSDVPEAVKAVAEERLAARARKDWAASDALRAKLAEMGYAVKDSKEGYTLTKNV